MKRYLWLLGLFVIAIAQSGCILSAYMASRSTARSVQITPVSPDSNGLPSGGSPTAYPETPEGVVSAFLEASQQDPMGMVQYLTPAQQQNLPPEGPLSLLNVDAPIKGFAIESAAVNPDTSAAMVVVGIQAGEEDLTRTFYLVLQNNTWFVDRIE